MKKKKKLGPSLNKRKVSELNAKVQELIRGGSQQSYGQGCGSTFAC
ncbi:MAG: class I lanthipeptide [Saonia sp.]